MHGFPAKSADPVRAIVSLTMLEWNPGNLLSVMTSSSDLP